MTPEREAEIRAVLNGDQPVDMDAALPIVSTAADDLLDEVDRLRAGIEAISSVSWDVVHPSWVKYMCRSLLNPTEGEDR